MHQLYCTADADRNLAEIVVYIETETSRRDIDSDFD
jgi:hypothetical protein